MNQTKDRNLQKTDTLIDRSESQHRILLGQDIENRQFMIDIQNRIESKHRFLLEQDIGDQTEIPYFRYNINQVEQKVGRQIDSDELNEMSIDAIEADLDR